MNEELRTNNAVRLRISTTLLGSWLPKPLQLRSEAGDDGVQIGFLVREQLFLCDLQALILSLAIDDGGDKSRKGLTKYRIKCRSKKWVESTFQLNKLC